MVGDTGKEQGLADVTAPVRRVLVALDASPASLAALKVGAEIASVFGVELGGLFVEDTQILGLGELPLVREVSLFSGTLRSLEPRELERRLQAHAERARSALVASARQTRVRCSFRVTRGVVAARLLEATSQRDLMTVGHLGWSGRSSGVGATARALFASASGSVLLLREKAEVSAPVCLLFEGSLLGEKALALAAGIARSRHVPIMVWILSEPVKEVERLRVAAEKLLGAYGGVEVHYRMLPSLRDAPEAFRAVRPGLVVFPAESGLTLESDLDLVDSIDASILLVR
jgi:nucleotide-binding universal stress UspA family protein